MIKINLILKELKIYYYSLILMLSQFLHSIHLSLILLRKEPRPNINLKRR